MSEPTRQLVAIMFTDIVGYSAMMQQSEQNALKAVEESLGLQNPIIEEYRGRILKKMGDGVISIFSSAYDAVQCGIKLQETFNRDSELQLKIAIHEGDVLIKDEDVFGDGINIAARIESLSTPGAILISDKVKSEIQNKDVETVSLGSFHLKNIDLPVHIHAVRKEGLTIPKKSDLKGKRAAGLSKRQKLMLAAFSLIVIVLLAYNWRNLISSKDDDSIIKIAVVPFRTSDHEEIQYLGEGMMDILSNKFSILPGLTSLDPQISNSLYNKAGTDILNLIKLPFWKEKQYDYLITGSIIKLGSETKFIGKLLNQKGKEIGAVELDCSNLDEVFLCVDQFSRLMISELQSNLRMDFSNQAPFSTDNWDALREYLAAEKARRSGDYPKAKGHYQKAVSIDSTFALAWLRGFTLTFDSPTFPFKKVNIHIHKLSPELQIYARAINQYLDGNFQYAIEELESFLRIYGDNVDVLYTLGWLSYFNGLINDRDPFKKILFDRQRLTYDQNNLSIELSILRLEIFKNNTEYIRELYQKYRNREISDINWLEIEIAHFNLTIVDFTYYTDLYKLYSLNINKRPNLSLFQYLKATARPLGSIGRLDVFINVLKNQDYHHLLSNDEFELLNHYVLLTQGKIKVAFKKYPERFYSRWSSWSNDIVYEPDFKVLDKKMAESILDYLPKSNYNPEDKWHRYNASFLSLLAGRQSEYEDGIDFLQSKRKEELQNQQYNEVRYTDYYVYRLKYSYSRYHGDPIKASNYLDSLLGSLRYDFRTKGGLMWSPKFTQGSIALEQGNLEKAKTILENCEYWPWFLTYAPSKYKLARVYDQLGEDEKALKRYKQFYTVYKNCDDFYQDNVAYASERIAYYESNLPSD